ncbi:MAG: hypothetical protein EOP52_04395 [Sphingobacteriales bacterium]|nr:MAG: hypothetical protein EOP52_04395 [Sphingobacteriales bacterium]
MRIVFLPLLLLATAFSGRAQDTTTQIVRVRKSSNAFDGVNMPFLIGLIIVVVVFATLGLFLNFRKLKRRKKIEVLAEPTEQEVVEEAIPAPPPFIPETIVVPEPVIKKAPEPQPDVTEAPVAEEPEAPMPDVFYLTVPGTDGRFAAGARKSQPTGCLYRFTVAPETPDEAEIVFAGDATDMRNAQAFRDLELLPACTFSGMPDPATFRFTQQPGLAVLDGSAWEVKKKIAIAFG